MKKKKEYINSLNKYREKYIQKMDDDFNTADAITVLFELSKDLNTNLNINSSKEVLSKSIRSS